MGWVSGRPRGHMAWAGGGLVSAHMWQAYPVSLGLMTMRGSTGAAASVGGQQAKVPAKHTHHLDPAPFAAVRPPKQFNPLPCTTTFPPLQTGVDIACTNSVTSERKSRRPKALATYPGSPHAAFVVSVYSWPAG